MPTQPEPVTQAEAPVPPVQMRCIGGAPGYYVTPGGVVYSEMRALFHRKGLRRLAVSKGCVRIVRHGRSVQTAVARLVREAWPELTPRRQ